MPMKPVLRISVFLLSIGLLFYSSCTKEYSCEGCRETNKPPTANAGVDTIIVLPVDSAKLDGSGSTDPDGTIKEFIWTKIVGPASFNINNASSEKTIVGNLTAGTYQFELKVTDNGGLSAKDTIRVIVDSVLTTNHPPVANAGADQTITLPINTINLDGSGSTDPENNIYSYQWTKISGPSLFNIATANTIETQVTDLMQGIYLFELKVTDAGGLFAKDTAQITVQIVVPQTLNCDITGRPISNASFPFSIQLPEPRYGIAVTTVGNKIFIAGGYKNHSGVNATDFSDRVDIYNITTGQWTITQVSEPRAVDAVAVLGNKIFFAGGWNGNALRTTVDIYDVSANTWSTTQLSQARGGMIAGSINNKVLFAGGVNVPDLFSIVDVYSTTTNSWSTESLSAARYSPKNFAYSTPNPPTVGQKIFFAAGQYCWIQDCASNRIDIYDGATNTWSYEEYQPYSPGTNLFSGISAGNKNYWVTGDYWEGGNLVEIRDEITHTTSYECLSGVLYGHPVNNGNKLIFPVSSFSMSTSSYKLTHFDIYDLATNTWSISKLQSHVNYHQLISVNNEVYVIGGYSNGNGFLHDKVYKLAF